MYIKPDQTEEKVIIYFHGNAEDLWTIQENITELSSKCGAHVFAMEYPGYGLYNYTKESLDYFVPSEK